MISQVVIVKPFPRWVDAALGCGRMVPRFLWRYFI